MRQWSVMFVLAWSACALDGGPSNGSIAVGDLCVPEQVPEGGFASTEAYLETSSAQCQSRVCGVFRLDGDPRHVCEDDPSTGCTPRAEIEAHVYCSCRCDGPDDGRPKCECPAAFVCEPVLELGGPGVEGSYCVRGVAR